MVRKSSLSIILLLISSCGFSPQLANDDASLNRHSFNIVSGYDQASYLLRKQLVSYIGSSDANSQYQLSIQPPQTNGVAIAISNDDSTGHRRLITKVAYELTSNGETLLQDEATSVYSVNSLLSPFTNLSLSQQAQAKSYVEIANIIAQKVQQKVEPF